MRHVGAFRLVGHAVLSARILTPVWGILLGIVVALLAIWVVMVVVLYVVARKST